MGNLLEYSSLTTKIKAMSSDLINIDGFKRLCECENISEALEELMKYKYYKNAFKDKDISLLHREDIEQTLLLSSMEDFSKIYKFSSGTPRHYLKLVAMYNQMYLLKRILRDILSNRSPSLDLRSYSRYVGLSADIDIAALLSSNNLQQFMDALKNTQYYDCLYSIFSKGNADIFDYALALDSYYFEISFKFAKNELKGDESKEVLSILGTRCDFLNMQWIYRAKKFYKVKNSELYAMLIPHYYRLSIDEIKALTEAENIDSFLSIFNTSYYGRVMSKLFTSPPGIEEFYSGMMEYMYTKNKNRNPYSLASLSYYLYFREAEINRVIEIIESIRYSLPSDDIITKILKLETRRSFA